MPTVGRQSKNLKGSTILVVDAEPAARHRLAPLLEEQGYRVELATTGEEGVRKFRELRPDLVLLEVALPELNGYEVARRILHLAWVPLIFLTGTADDAAVVRGLELGAVDYIVKPFRPRPLLARIRSGLRRAWQTASPSPSSPPTRYDDGYLVVDLSTHRVSVQGRPVDLTPKEFDVLRFLMQHAGQLCSPQEILTNVWGPDTWGGADYVYTYIRRLRGKLEPDANAPRYLVNEASGGYRFEGETRGSAADPGAPAGPSRTGGDRR